jgi:Fe(3+) dicitrate transport protein
MYIKQFYSKSLFLILFIYIPLSLFAQADSTSIELDIVKVTSSRPLPERLSEVDETMLFGGKKNEVLRLSGLNANLVSNNTRQVFARVAGISVWENDGSGVQISVAARGLSPNRSWEFNVRQNGYDATADAFGYPEAYYNPPLEAVEQIQVIRGAGSLQFGPQFGGVVNYILKQGTADKPFSFETQNTVGSYGLLSSFNAIGGKHDSLSYYAYNHSRKGDGWRENGSYEVRNSHASVRYKLGSHSTLSAEYTNMYYLIQQSGGLTDEQFAQDPQQSGRSRNWFSVPWNLAALNFDSKINSHLKINLKLFGLIGERNSIGFTAKSNIPDTLNRATGKYAARQLDRDFYKNMGIEFRGIYGYNLFKQKHHLAFGARGYVAHIERKQKGKGDENADFNTTLQADSYPVALDLSTQNAAFFLENLFKITPQFSLTPGLRLEHIRSKVEGQIGVNATGEAINIANQEAVRTVLLAGLSAEYKIKATNFYANFHQAYRPVLYSDLTPPATTDVIDPNLQDATGFNADLGYRGIVGNFLNFDLSAFYLLYNNKIGTIRKYVNDDPAQSTYQYRTNLGKSRNMGIEAYIEVQPIKAFAPNSKASNLSLFASIAFINAEYLDFETTQISGTAPDIQISTGNLKGNTVEYAPTYIHNFGLSYAIAGLSTTLQTRMNSQVFSDASNTEIPTNDGTIGLIEGYQVWDWALEYRFGATNKYNLKGGINNIANTMYATRRAGGYPGPGLLPSDGRTWFLSIGAKL